MKKQKLTPEQKAAIKKAVAEEKKELQKSVTIFNNLIKWGRKNGSLIEDEKTD